MGKVDVMAREYLSDRHRFADAFNYLLYGGRRIIDAERLQPFDTAESTTNTKKTSRLKPASKARDTLKLWQAMKGEDAAYAILGLEEQTYVSRAMSARCMLYDAMAYDRQVKRIAKQNKAQKRWGSTNGEFLSGMLRSDVLLPVITLVLYLGAEEWDEPESLHGIFGNVSDDLLRYIPDYRINLVAPARMNKPDFEKFSTELGLVLKYIKYSGDDEGLGRMVSEDTRYRSIGADSAALINAVTKSRLEIDEGDEEVDMCRAIDEMRRKSREEGMESGIAKGDRRRLLADVRGLMANTGWGAMEALRMIGVPEADRPAIARELGAV